VYPSKTPSLASSLCIYFVVFIPRMTSSAMPEFILIACGLCEIWGRAGADILEPATPAKFPLYELPAMAEEGESFSKSDVSSWPSSMAATSEDPSTMRAKTKERSRECALLACCLCFAISLNFDSRRESDPRLSASSSCLGAFIRPVRP
jgi:hypothetical protein